MNNAARGTVIVQYLNQDFDILEYTHVPIILNTVEV